MSMSALLFSCFIGLIIWCSCIVVVNGEQRATTSGYGKKAAATATTPMVTTFRPTTMPITSTTVSMSSTSTSTLAYEIPVLTRNQPSKVFIEDTTIKDGEIESELDDPPNSFEDTFMPRNDELIYNLMESLMKTIHEKLRRAETLENTCRTMLDQMSRRLDYNNDRMDTTVSRLNSIDQKLQQQQQKMMSGQWQMGATSSTVDNRLQSLGSKVDSLSTKLSELKNDVVRDKRGTLVPSVVVDGDLSAQSSERRDIIRDKSGRMIYATESPQSLPDERVTKDIESVKDTLNSLDTRFQDWMHQVSNSIGDLHDAIIEPDDGIKTSADLDVSASSTMANNQSSSMLTEEETRNDHHERNADLFNSKETKIDKLFRKINPVLRVTEKMDEMWDVVLGTQRLVDDSLQKSDQLLTNSYRQVQSLADVKIYLQRQTGKIMANLEQVEEWLKEQGASAPQNIDPKMLTEGIRDILNKTMQLNEKVTQEGLLTSDEELLAQERSSEPLFPPEDEAYHSDTTDYAHDRRKTQLLEPKSEGIIGVNATTTGRTTMLPSFKRKQMAAPAAAAALSPANATLITGKMAATKTSTCPFQGPPGVNCADLKRRGVTRSGVYYILIKGTTYWFMKVYCDMETDGGGWTVMHNRNDYKHPRENFIRDWNDYKNGFGDMNREFWLGNENVFMLTNQEDYVLRVDLEDFDGHKRYAIYTKFKIYSEAENYKLEIGNYEGDAGDSLNDPWYGSNLNPFSTYDRDNDRSSLNCASMLRGGWWWRSCGRGLNGIYLTNPTDLSARQGIVWFRWRGWDYTLKRARMAIRPKEFVAIPMPTTKTTTPNPTKG